ncbi:8023_t:CDS:2 [Gigaspora margarita]|uniref:8023_t:CDS:1 n=1 Tax=Gigaspora margarita TaxID=4874 RepID=A0ABN7VS25_GIGMA|nr:8023_t:CDS:2 [Gigaspora margarita]
MSYQNRTYILSSLSLHAFLKTMNLNLILNTTKTNNPNIEISHSLNIAQLYIIILQNALPCNYYYVIDLFKAIQPHDFLEAHPEAFEVEFCINTFTVDGTKTWLDEFTNLHKVTMRETQVKLKQGEKKYLSTDAAEKGKAISAHIRDTHCPVTLKIQLQNKHCTYPCTVSMLFHHNHPLISNYITSFCSVSEKTKESFFELFCIGHNSASAYHTYLEEIQLRHENNEEILADRSICPHKHDIYYLHQKYLNVSIGAKDGKEMFNHLAEEVLKFNDSNKGNAWMQSYIAPTENDLGRPFILIVLTNLMKSTLDALNTPLTILSTSTPAGGLPLAIILTLDETAQTFTWALNMLKNMLPLEAFSGRGPIVGPQIVMTDDCNAERKALCNTWDKATLLLCVFHFLQAVWRWLWDEWAVTFRQQLPIRNNNTKNFTEAGIRIIKDIVFGRIQAFNVVQIFHFIINAMDLYYSQRLLAIAHNKLDSFIALRFRLLDWNIGLKEDIEVVSFDSMILKHRSSKNKNIWYLVDMRLGICECNMMGAPCKHQSSIATHYKICGLNQIPMMSVNSRQHYAYLALGDKCKGLDFYADLHQMQLDQEFLDTTMKPVTSINNNLVSRESHKNDYNNSNDRSTLSESMSLMPLSESGIDDNNNDESESDTDLHQSAIDELRWFSNDLESLLKEGDTALDRRVFKFVKIYKKHRSIQDTHIRSTHTLNKIPQGRPKENRKNYTYETEYQENPDWFIMPARSKRQYKKRPHDLNQALKKIRPNGH